MDPIFLLLLNEQWSHPILASSIDSTVFQEPICSSSAVQCMAVATRNRKCGVKRAAVCQFHHRIANQFLKHSPRKPFHTIKPCKILSKSKEKKKERLPRKKMTQNRPLGQ